MNDATMDATLSLTIVEGDIGLLTFDMPNKRANVLSQSVLTELSEYLDQLADREDLAGLILISGKPGTFIAGADLREFAAAQDVTHDWTRTMCMQGRKLMQRLSQLPFVTVAAIDGLCLGGGAELALWCDRRVMSSNPKTQFGLPEVKLGLFPGWGGTARAPRIIGLSNAVELISGGEPVSAERARALGLATDVVPPEKLQDAAVRLIRQEQESQGYLADREQWSAPIDISETELFFLGATANAYIQQQTKGQYPAPAAAVEVMLQAAHMEIEAACELEADGMANLFGTPINRALINVFFLSDRNKKDPGVTDASVKPRETKSLGIVGSGIMGSSIAAVTVRRGTPVSITDVNQEVLAKGTTEILEQVAYNRDLHGPDVKRALQYGPLVNATMTLEEVAGCDLVIEAVIEHVNIKKEVYSRIEPLLGPNAILATNTSTIPIARLAQDLKHPERFCGIHFFNPVRKMPLVEVIRGPATSDETVVTATAYAKSIGKSPIVVEDGPGFLVNRVLMPYMNESVELLLDGASLLQVDKLAKRFGMPMGPFQLYDVVGIDTAFFSGAVMVHSFPERVATNPLVMQMVKAGRLGEKSGAGFYAYNGKKNSRGELDPKLDEIVGPLLHERETPSDEEITHRLFLPMLLEATRLLEEKKVRDPRDIDLALIYGIGFPPFKGGLLYWADTIGAAQILEWLKPYAHLGERMEPTQILIDMAKSGKRFYTVG